MAWGDLRDNTAESTTRKHREEKKVFGNSTRKLVLAALCGALLFGAGQQLEAVMSNVD